MKIKILHLFFVLMLGTQSYAKNIEQIKHGEKLFLSYCSGCHSLKYTSYPKVSMPTNEAKKWFKIVPPDLSLTTNYRGKKWVINYLSGFYKDDSRPFGSNNKLLINTQMPNILNENNGQTTQEILDIADFLELIANPNKQQSYKIGYAVLIFLSFFLIKLLALRKKIKQLT